MTATASEKPKTDTLHGTNLILDVENFGPIAEAKNIEFKPMTVFVGPSNTGKTYLATLLHAILKTTQRLIESPPMSFDITHDPRWKILQADFFPNYYESLVNQQGYPFDEINKRISDLSSGSISLLNENTQRFLKSIARESSMSISTYFGVNDLTNLSRHSTGEVLNSKIRLQESSTSLQLSIDDSCVVNFELPALIRIYPDIKNYLQHYKDMKPEDFFDLDLTFELGIYTAVVIRDFPSSHYLPAGRTGLIEAYRELAASIIRHITNRPKEDQELAVSVITGEFLRYMVLLNSKVQDLRNNSKIKKIAQVLEGSVLRGRINVRDTAGISHPYFEQDNASNIPLESASSMITELAPIVLFIRQFVEEGDLLIIDEPEAHLHPAAQQQMAAALAFMVRSGLRVLITTHSHYMVEQLSAFVNASKLDETTRKRALSLGGALGEEDIYLNEDETAVYGFDESNADDGTVVYEIPLGEHREYAPRDHSKAVNRQYNRLQRVLEARERLGV